MVMENGRNGLSQHGGSPREEDLSQSRCSSLSGITEFGWANEDSYQQSAIWVTDKLIRDNGRRKK
jgi:hypothetical protein